MSGTIVVKQCGKSVVTVSENIAEVFGKSHKNVLQAIDKKVARLIKLKRNSRLYFQPRDYLDLRGKTQRSFNLTRLGFDYLVLGFGGEDADTYKLAYIDQFYKYEKALQTIVAHKGNASWVGIREVGKLTHRAYTEQGVRFLEYAAAQRGDDGYSKHFYSNLAIKKLRALFTFGVDVKPSRDLLNEDQLRRVEMADVVADKALMKGMVKGLHYKIIYTEASHAIEALALLLGEKSEVQK